MKSPEGGHELRRLAGNAEQIHGRGESWKRLATQMHSTASYLKQIGDSDVNKSKGTDKLGDLAKDSTDDLEKAAVRYEGTGKALSTYGTKLDTAQTWIHPRIDDIETAENQYQTALGAQSDAQDDSDDLDDDASDADKTKAGDALETANGDVTRTKGVRDELWKEFDQHFEAWEEAYDDAVSGIQHAMDSADNNDGFWEFVDDLLSVLNWVILGLSILALIIGAPIFGVLGLIILGLSLLALGLTLLKFATGRATLSDVLWSAASLIPFGLGKFARGAPALGNVVRGGRGVVATAIRSGLPRVSLFRPSTWGTPIRWAFAGRTARLALPRPGLFVNPLRSIAYGGESTAVQVERFITTMQNSTHGPALQNFIAQTVGSMPSIGARSYSGFVWLLDTASNTSGVVPNGQPDIPGAKDVTINTIKDLIGR